MNLMYGQVHYIINQQHRVATVDEWYRTVYTGYLGSMDNNSRVHRWLNGSRCMQAKTCVFNSLKRLEAAVKILAKC